MRWTQNGRNVLRRSEENNSSHKLICLSRSVETNFITQRLIIIRLQNEQMNLLCTKCEQVQKMRNTSSNLHKILLNFFFPLALYLLSFFTMKMWKREHHIKCLPLKITSTCRGNLKMLLYKGWCDDDTFKWRQTVRRRKCVPLYIWKQHGFSYGSLSPYTLPSNTNLTQVTRFPVECAWNYPLCHGSITLCHLSLEYLILIGHWSYFNTEMLHFIKC